MKTADTFKVLLIGPRINPTRSNIGGATISFESMIDHFQKKGVSHRVLDTQKFAGMRAVLFPFYFISKVIGCTVVLLNASSNGIKYLGPLAYWFARLFSIKIAIRPFGDSLLNGYTSASFIIRFLMIRSVFKADILYAQTNDQFLKFKEISENVKQLMTARPSVKTANLRGDRPYQRRFLYMGHIKKSKGLNELLAAKKSLGDSYIVDIYGPIMESDFRFLENESYYKGVINDKEKLAAALVQYDLLILPTFYEGEGYPGSIIEAYSYGLPVISTNWKSIPEIVEDGETGFLVEPESTKALEEGMEAIDESNYKRMSDNALSKFKKNFTQELILNQVVDELKLISK